MSITEPIWESSCSLAPALTGSSKVRSWKQSPSKAEYRYGNNLFREDDPYRLTLLLYLSTRQICLYLIAPYHKEIGKGYFNFHREYAF